MSVIDFVTYATQALFLGVAIYLAWQTRKRPTRSNVYILAFFALLVVTITYSWVESILDNIPGPDDISLTAVLILIMPYVLLRLARDFSHVPHRHMRLAEIGLLGSVVLAVSPGAEGTLALLAMVTYFAAVSVLAAFSFYAGSVDSNGITRKRLRALCIASILLGAALFTVVISSVTGGAVSNVVVLLRQLMLASSAILYLVGFAPPTIVRRAWQEPELRQFLRHSLSLPRWTSAREILDHIQQLTAETIGAPNAVIGLWNPDTEMIDFPLHSLAPGQTIGGKAFLQQRTILSLDTLVDDPESAEFYTRGEAYAVIAAPISTDHARIGVIALYSPNPPIFAEDDLSLLTLLADQIAVLLENRRHLEAQAELAAREETARLKDEFLSVAAHDLKTPLTTILATGQYLERRLASEAESPELRSIQRLNREAKRLRSLVQGLLDASRIERGQLLTNVEPTDVSWLVSDVLDRTDAYSTHVIESEIGEGLFGEVDPVRIQQVLENLLENARKYSPPGSSIWVRLWADGDDVRLSVSDDGPGISPADQAQIFNRYYRGSESSNGAETGIGLGLYICREIIEQHGGQIWVESAVGQGATFHVSLKRDLVRAASVDNDTVDTHR